MAKVTTTNESLAVVSAEVPQELAGAVSDWLAENGTYCAAWEDREGGPSRIEICIPDDPLSPDWAPYSGMLCATADEAMAKISEACVTFGCPAKPQVAKVRREDWSESWKRFFKTMRVSPRLVVRPPWEEYQARDGEHVIVLDPGMSFGTGKHATTRTCLEFIDELAGDNPERDFLDIGCGSGILSIAAAKLGFHPVSGIDIDGDAVRIAAENAAANDAKAAFFTEDLSKCERRACVVVANVLAPVLIEHARQVAGCVMDDGCGSALVLSGILDTQYPAVREAYGACGFVERRSVLDGEWRSGVFGKV